MIVHGVFRSFLSHSTICSAFRSCTVSSHSMMRYVRRVSSSPPSAIGPRIFPSTGFELIDPATKFEEETLPFYRKEEYYPMHIGQVVHGHYQVVSKLGFGTTSTVWLARDLWDQSFLALKVHINTLKHNQELEIYDHLTNTPCDFDFSEAKEHVRQLKEAFKLKGPHGDHDVFIMAPMALSLSHFLRARQGRPFHLDFVQQAISQILHGLIYLHYVKVVHTDLHLDNLLIAPTDNSVMAEMEEVELYTPSRRKQADDRTIHQSRMMFGGYGPGPLTICDFGHARIGEKHRGIAMPAQYRAPEVILDMEWGSSIDMWSVGFIAWNLLEKEPLFRIYDNESQEQNDAHHLAAITALLGPPPPEFLTRSEKTAKFWSEDGQWKGPVPLPLKTSFESLASALTGEEKEMFVSFMEYLIRWLPEERETALQMFFHPFTGNKRRNQEPTENGA
ncbi:kinase-like protein [Nemania sp. FL0916]|nr:kinase-like protein [Nemania sp. FL0916]